MVSFTANRAEISDRLLKQILRKPSCRLHGEGFSPGRNSARAENPSPVFSNRARIFSQTLQTIAEDRTMFYLLRSSAIICDRLRSCDHMETKVLRSAMEMYPIII